MTNYAHGTDLVTDILFRNGEPTDGTSDFDTVALQYLNRGYQMIWTGGAELVPTINEEWWWLRKNPPGVITLDPRVDGGTVSVTNNSAAVTFSAAPDPTIQATTTGWFFRVNDHADVFRVSTHTSGAVAATLDSVYTGTTATAVAYKLYKTEYTLATDVLRLVSPMRSWQENHSEVEGMSIISLDRRWPTRIIDSGVPDAFAHIDEQLVKFSHYGGVTGTKLIRLEYPYLFIPADLTDATGSVPAMPQHYRRILSDIGTFFLMLDKNDNRADAIGLASREGLRAMARDQRTRMMAFGRDYGKVMPRPERLPDAIRPLRTETGVIIG